MARYRQVHTTYYLDSFTLELTPEEKFFYLYLMTNSKTTQTGIYEIPKVLMEMETGYNRETVQKLITRFEQYGKIKYCEETKELFVINWAKYNWINSPKVIKCIETEIKKVKHKPFVHQYLQKLKEYGYGIESLSIDSGEEEEEEKEEEQEREKEDAPKPGTPQKSSSSTTSTSNSYTLEFETFWNEYPRKRDKRAAYLKFKKALESFGFDVILKGTKGYKTECEREKTGMKYIKLPKTFLNNESFMDYQEEQKRPEPMKLKPINETTVEEGEPWIS